MNFSKKIFQIFWNFTVIILYYYIYCSLSVLYPSKIITENYGGFEIYLIFRILKFIEMKNNYI